MRWIFVVAPLALVAWDLFEFPYLRHSESKSPVVLSQLLDQSSIHIGRLRGHEIHVWLDSIASDDYLKAHSDARNCLVVSNFLLRDPLDPRYRTGQLARAVERRLSGIELRAGTEFTRLLQAGGTRTAGSVLWFDTGLTGEKHKAFPVDHVAVVLFYDDASPKERLDAIRGGLEAALQRAAEARVEKFVFPALTMDPSGGGELTFDKFFEEVISGIPLSRRPPEIHFSFYENWADSFLERAANGLNVAWGRAFAGDLAGAGSIYRADFRLLMLLASVCLLICSFAIELTVKTALIISTSFIALGLGSETILGILFPVSSNAALVAKIIVLLVFAVGFRWLIHWNPKDLFAAKGVAPDGS